jgi:hypothetical protein
MRHAVTLSRKQPSGAIWIFYITRLFGYSIALLWNTQLNYTRINSLIKFMYDDLGGLLYL